MSKNKDYQIFFSFIDAYSECGFKGINNLDSFMIKLNNQLGDNGQYFYIADLIKLQILYTSPQVKSILGIEPEKFDPSTTVSIIHPLDSARLSKGLSIELQQAREMFQNKTGTLLLSSNFRKRKPNGEYSQCLIQAYLFYSKSPVETVYALSVNTPVDSFSKIQKGYYHWYVGTDFDLFRYPDKELLGISSAFSDREFEIIQLVKTGLKTKEIAKKLFLSPATISTHRKNILKKSGKSTIYELIFDLNKTGVV